MDVILTLILLSLPSQLKGNCWNASLRGKLCEGDGYLDRYLDLIILDSPNVTLNGRPELVLCLNEVCRSLTLNQPGDYWRGLAHGLIGVYVPLIIILLIYGLLKAGRRARRGNRVGGQRIEQQQQQTHPSRVPQVAGPSNYTPQQATAASAPKLETRAAALHQVKPMSSLSRTPKRRRSRRISYKCRPKLETIQEEEETWDEQVEIFV